MAYPFRHSMDPLRNFTFLPFENFAGPRKQRIQIKDGPYPSQARAAWWGVRDQFFGPGPLSRIRPLVLAASPGPRWRSVATGLAVVGTGLATPTPARSTNVARNASPRTQCPLYQ